MPMRSEMDEGRTRRLEVIVRVAVLAVALALLPSIFIGDVSWYWQRALGLGLHHLPYRDFSWEFPPLTVPILGLVPLARHQYWIFFTAFSGIMIACELASLRVLRRHTPQDERAPLTRYWHVVGIPLATFAWFRFDFLAVLFAVLAYTKLVDGRRATGSLLGGIAAKLWPGALAVLLVTQRRGRQLLELTLATVGLFVSWYLFSPSGLVDFLRFRRGSGLQLESVGGALHMLIAGGRPTVVSGAWVVGANGYGWVDTAGLGVVAAVAGALMIVGRGRRLNPAAVCGGLTLVVLLASHLLSPQYLVWPLPFMAAAWGAGERRATKAFAAAAFLTWAELMVYHDLIHGARWLAAVVVLRNGLLALSAFWLLAPELARTRRSAPTDDTTIAGETTIAGAVDALVVP